MRRSARVALLIAILLALVAFASYATGRAKAPTNVSSPPQKDHLTVSIETFDDPFETTLSLHSRHLRPLSVNTTGVLTGTRCQRGLTLDSGAVAWQINTRRLLALHTSVPPYRDLGLGSVGDDVRALSRTLAVAAGRPVPTSAVFTSDTLADYNTLRRTARLPQVDAFRLSDIIWLPAPAVTVARCGAQVGDRLTAGQTLAELKETSVRLRVDHWPAKALPGPRRLHAGAAHTRLEDDERVVSDAQFIARVLESVPPNRKGRPVSAELRLVEGIPAAVVPASSIVLPGGPCVIGADGSPYAVAILDSMLGTSVVRAEDSDLPDALQIVPDAKTC